MNEKKVEKVTEKSLPGWKEFEIEAYRVESQLAAEKNYAESRLRAIAGSRTWRLTAPIRQVIDLIVRPLLRTSFGRRLLRWLDTKI
jgi:hypothetical protein